MTQVPKMLLPFLAEPDIIGPPTIQTVGIRLTNELAKREIPRTIDKLELKYLFENEPETHLHS